MRSAASPTSKRLTTALSHENKFLANDVLPCESQGAQKEHLTRGAGREGDKSQLFQHSPHPPAKTLPQRLPLQAGSSPGSPSTLEKLRDRSASGALPPLSSPPSGGQDGTVRSLGNSPNPFHPHPPRTELKNTDPFLSINKESRYHNTKTKHVQSANYCRQTGMLLLASLPRRAPVAPGASPSKHDLRARAFPQLPARDGAEQRGEAGDARSLLRSSPCRGGLKCQANLPAPGRRRRLQGPECSDA